MAFILLNWLKARLSLSQIDFNWVKLIRNISKWLGLTCIYSNLIKHTQIFFNWLQVESILNNKSQLKNIWLCSIQFKYVRVNPSHFEKFLINLNQLKPIWVNFNSIQSNKGQGAVLSLALVNTKRLDEAQTEASNLMICAICKLFPKIFHFVTEITRKTHYVVEDFRVLMFF